MKGRSVVRMLLLLLAIGAGGFAMIDRPAAGGSAPATTMPFSLHRLSEGFSGTAEDVLHVSGYTYVRLVDASFGDRWVVGLRKAIAVGDRLSVRSIGTAQQFHSRQLQRSFDALWFGILSVDKVAGLPVSVPNLKESS
jgi:hypothetical protein